MPEEGLSQDDIDSLLSDNNKKDKDENKQEEVKEQQNEESIDINPTLKELTSIVNTSLEDVLKTLFSLDIVSKFIDLNLKQKSDLSFEEGIFISCKLTLNSNSSGLFLFIKKDFASIMSDLMLMGPGEAKEALEDDDLDAIKEMISQVFGNVQTSFKESQGKEISFEVEKIDQEAIELEDSTYYYAEFDIAIPNIKSDIITFIAKKDEMDSIFAEKVEKEVPFQDVEESTQAAPTQPAVQRPNAPDNLDIILDVELDIEIKIGEKYMLIKDLLNLREGSIIELEKSIDEPMDILINNKVVAQGVVVVVDGRFGVKITNIDTKEERIKSLGN